jgi:hypothetical protein
MRLMIGRIIKKELLFVTTLWCATAQANADMGQLPRQSPNESKASQYESQSRPHPLGAGLAANPAMTSSLFRPFGECCAALSKIEDNIVGSCPTVPGGLWIADVSRCAPEPARGRGERAVPYARGAPCGEGVL